MQNAGIKLKQVLSHLPILIKTDFIFFPDLVAPIILKEEDDVRLALKSHSKQTPIFICASPHGRVECSFPVGTVCQIVRTTQLKNGKIKILLQGLYRASFFKKENTRLGRVTPIETKISEKLSAREEELFSAIKQKLNQLSSLGKILSPDLLKLFQEDLFSYKLLNLIPTHLQLCLKSQQEILEETDRERTLELLNLALCSELFFTLEQSRLRKQTEKIKEIFFNTPPPQKPITSSPIDEKENHEEISYLKKLTNKKISKESLREVEKLVTRLSFLPKESSERASLQSYLDHIVDLPWGKLSLENTDLGLVESSLNEEHFGLNHVKKRIIEYLCVKKLNPSGKAPILCLVGPPGVGKTSLGKIVAKSLQREFFKISLAGIKDESDLRGHRRTYVGAYPGKIMEAVKLSKKDNPVVMLDEIDKISRDKGDPASALLEILDPSQNSSFVDHYLNLPYDLSQILFIATANDLEPLTPPLKDRLEIISIAPYSVEEKIVIAKTHLWPKHIKESGLGFCKLSFEKSCQQHLIQGYTKEPGLRFLEQQIEKICRFYAKEIVFKKHKTKGIRISKKNIMKILGPPAFKQEILRIDPEPGVAYALAYTGYGGRVLAIESQIFPTVGTLLTTGALGKIMEESIQTSLSYLRSKASFFQICPETLLKNKVHIHIPENSLPKDGASAGIAITSSLLSALNKRALPQGVCMTGEITLKGKVLPVGGLQEKLLAAKEAGARKIILPLKNLNELESLNPNIYKGVQIQGVETFEEAYEILYGRTNPDEVEC